MSGFFNRARAALRVVGAEGDAAPAPDGDRDELKSGRWPTQSIIPVEAFPDGLVLRASDRNLAPSLAVPVRLADVRVGRHRVELLLGATHDAVDLSMRVPTASNQFKDPYIIMEAEEGNSPEVAVREIHFHLLGRTSERDVARVDWEVFFARALTALERLRARHR